jgi:hypothetical protein
MPGFFQYVISQLPRLKRLDKRDITDQDRQNLSGDAGISNLKRPSSSDLRRSNDEKDKMSQSVKQHSAEESYRRQQQSTSPASSHPASSTPSPPLLPSISSRQQQPTHSSHHAVSSVQSSHASCPPHHSTPQQHRRRDSSHVLYAVFALLHDLSVDELMMVKDEINQRLNKYRQEASGDKCSLLDDEIYDG